MSGATHSKQYRIMRTFGAKPWQLVCTYGFLDVREIGVFAKQNEARAKAKEHAAAKGWKPIILT
jgi:hypothetical protein